MTFTITTRKVINNIEKNAEASGDIIQKLGSQKRTTKISDDIGSTLLADKINSDKANYKQGLFNITQAGLAVEKAANAISALSEVSYQLSVLQEDAATLVTKSTTRAAENTDAQELKNEYSRIIAATTHNGVALLNTSGSATTLNVQDVPGSSVIALPTNLGSVSSFSLTTAENAISAETQTDEAANLVVSAIGAINGSAGRYDAGSIVTNDAEIVSEVAYGRATDVEQDHELTLKAREFIQSSQETRSLIGTTKSQKAYLGLFSFTPEKKTVG